MITIFCGDNEVEARDAFASYINLQKTGGANVQFADLEQIVELTQLGANTQFSLWGEQNVYSSSNIIGQLKRKFGRLFKETLEKLNELTNTQIVIFEPKSAYDLGISTYKWKFIKEYKPQNNIFNLLTDFKPGNKLVFLQNLGSVLKSQSADFIYAMILKHIRLSIKLKSSEPVADNPYMLLLAKKTSSLFDEQTLNSIYLRLLKYEAALKTSSTPFSAHECLQTIAIYML